MNINENTSLFEIYHHFLKLSNTKKPSKLNYLEWLDVGNVGKISISMNKLKLLEEILDHLKYNYTIDNWEDIIYIKEYKTHEKRVFLFFKKTKVIKTTLCKITLRTSKKNTQYFTIKVYKKYAFKVAEEIALEIVNNIGVDCKIRY